MSESEKPRDLQEKRGEGCEKMTMTMTLRKIQTSVDGGLALQARVHGS